VSLGKHRKEHAILGTPETDPSGNLDAIVLHRRDTYVNLMALETAGDGEIAVCTDTDAPCTIVYSKDGANPSVGVPHWATGTITKATIATSPKSIVTGSTPTDWCPRQAVPAFVTAGEVPMQVYVQGTMTINTIPAAAGTIVTLRTYSHLMSPSIDLEFGEIITGVIDGSGDLALPFEIRGSVWSAGAIDKWGINIEHDYGASITTPADSFFSETYLST